MEDDEEIMSHQSEGSGSPLSPSPSPSSRQNGRVTVTVASAPPPPPPQNSLTLALPVDQLGRQGGYNNTTMGSGGGGGGGREDCWSEGATSVLIDAWGERYMELSRGNLKQKHWQEVADIVSSREDYRKTPKTDIQCKNRIDTVKKKYKTEKQKIAAGCGPSRWPFFQRLDDLIGSTTKINTLVPGRALMPALPTVTPVQVGFSGAKNVPMGIPVGVRPMSNPHLKQPENFRSQVKPIINLYPKINPKSQFKRKGPVDMDMGSDESEPKPEQYQDSSDGFPPEPRRVRVRKEMMNVGCDEGRMNKTKNRNGSNGNGGGGEERSWGNSVRELTRAILKFGEAYEQAESSKLQQLMEMEKQRMKFAKELELQRMQFFMKTQVELSQLKEQYRRVVSCNHNGNNNNITNDNNNSDCSE